jgi:CheY-like chemotaxis protein
MPTVALKTRKLLVIDDDHDICEVLACAIESTLGWDVTVAHSGLTGLKMAEEGQPDLILLDIMMPGLNGPDTLGYLRRTPQTAHIPIVFISAVAQTRNHNELMALGPVAVFPKPFDPFELADQLASLMAP